MPIFPLACHLIIDYCSSWIELLLSHELTTYQPGLPTPFLWPFSTPRLIRYFFTNNCLQTSDFRTQHYNLLAQYYFSIHLSMCLYFQQKTVISSSFPCLFRKHFSKHLLHSKHVIMNRVNQLPCHHIHIHFPFLCNIPPIISIISVFLLVTNLVLTYL